jgi:lipid II isoglutaminyl synthase (glutamine-hydrolysing)
MLFRAQVAAARLAARTSRAAGAGGGTTLPGRLLLALEPDAIGRLGRSLSRGTIVISATNGKTTTARMLGGMISPPLRLSANRAGANLASGIASALLRDDGSADAGLFEVDEAALPGVAAQLDPAVLVLANLFRDQLDRYGELEAIAERWSTLTSGLGESRVLVRNGDDPLVATLDPGRARTLAFGIDDPSAGLAGIEHASDSKWCGVCGRRLEYRTVFLGHLGDWQCPNCGAHRPALDVAATNVELEGLEASRFDLVTPLGTAPVRLPVPGLYNVYNAVAAAAAACASGVAGIDRIAAALERFDPAFGRFERLSLDGRDAVVILIKNPAGANEVVRTLTRDGDAKTLMVALNDRIADGRDTSWVWDVDFELLANSTDHVVTTGTRAAEMALRLRYADLDSGSVEVEPQLEAALDRAAALGDGPLYLLATYTAMLDLRQILAARGVVKPFWETA